MRRILASAALGLVLLAAAAAFGWLYLAHASPELLRHQLEARLGEALGTQVSLGPVSLGFDRDGIELVGAELRAFPSDRGEALVAERVEIQVDLWAALIGVVRLRGIDLSAPTLRLRRSAAGLEIDSSPGTSAPAEASAPAAPPEPWRKLSADSLPRLDLSGGRLIVVGGAGQSRDLELAALEGSLERRWLRGGAALDLAGELRAGGQPAGRFRIEGHAADDTSLRLTLDGVSLAPLASLAGGRVVDLAPRGRASGELRLQIDAAGRRALSVDLASPRLHLEPAPGGARRPLDLDGARLDATGRDTGGGFALAGRAWIQKLALPFEATLADGRLQHVRLLSLDLAGLAPLAGALAEPDRAPLRSALEHLRGGRLEDLDLAWETPAGTRRAPRLRARWRVAGASLLAGSASQLEGLSGEGSYDGDVLELRGVSARLDGQPLPVLDLRLSGLAQIESLAELRCVEPAPRSSLPGRRPLAEWLAGDDPKGGEPSWRRLRVSASWLEHPALLCAVERLSGEVQPDRESGGVRVTLERAVWAGVPLRGSAHYRVRPDERASLRIEVGPPFEPAQPELRRSGWAHGRFEFETRSLGDWKARSASGSFLARDTHLVLEETRLDLDPGPTLEGSVDLDLGTADRVPFDLRAEVRRGTVQDLYAARGFENQATGSLVGVAQLSGGLRPGHAALADARGAFSLHARDGVIRQRFRLLLAVAMASETLNPFRERGTIRYGAMDAEGRVEDGHFVLDTFSIDGPALRVAASGRIAVTEPHAAELVMGLFFFRTLDSVIGRVPVLNRIILGKDANLIGAYVAITGPWDGLGARVIPMETLMKGPVGFVFEGLPSFLRGSLRRVQTLLTNSGAAAPGKADS